MIFADSRVVLLSRTHSLHHSYISFTRPFTGVCELRIDERVGEGLGLRTISCMFPLVACSARDRQHIASPRYVQERTDESILERFSEHVRGLHDKAASPWHILVFSNTNSRTSLYTATRVFDSSIFPIPRLPAATRKQSPLDTVLPPGNRLPSLVRPTVAMTHDPQPRCNASPRHGPLRRGRLDVGRVPNRELAEPTKFVFRPV